MLFGSETIRAVMATLDDMGFEQLLALPAVPVNNARRIRYPMVVTTSAGGEQWYLRSFGTAFDLVDPSRRGPPNAWYSVGWGMVAQQQVAELLLVHAREEQAAGAIRLETEIHSVLKAQGATRTEGQIRHGRWGAQLRLSAMLGQTTGSGAKV
jgi:hypothetical protein